MDGRARRTYGEGVESGREGGRGRRVASARGAAPRPLRRARLTRAQAAEARRLARSFPLARVDAAVGPSIRRVHPPRTAGDARPGPPTVDVALEASDGSARACLRLDPSFAAGWVDRLVGGPGDVPTAVGLTAGERGVLAYGLARWLAPTPWSVAEVADGPRPIAVPGITRWTITLGFAHAEAHGVVAAVEPLPPPDPVGPGRLRAFGDLPTVGRLVMAEVELRGAVAATLERGDVVLPEQPDLRVTPAGGIAGRLALHLGGGRLRLDVRSDGSTLEVLGPSRAGGGPTLSHRRHTMSERRDDDPSSFTGPSASTGPAADERPPAWDLARALPVAVTIEVARIELTLEEIAGLGPGEVLALPCPVDEPVALRAGSRVIAHGELVEVEGEVGVRIVRLADPAG
ncbi:MAG: FliM/FliN family flagellar motor switch protein [Sandaracinaceae bacterium]